MKRSSLTWKTSVLLTALACVLLVFSIRTVESRQAASDSSKAAASQANKKIYVRDGTEGTIAGTINLKGEVPEMMRIDMSQDSVCDEINRNPRMETIVVNEGKLVNAFVYVKSRGALDKYEFETPSSEVVLEHKKCRYVPHVLGMQVNQTLKILNSDPTTHNTHPTPGNNAEWNQTQPVGGPPILKKFNREESFIPFKDNQHPWEKAYVGVFSHPFFSVTGIEGTYRIEGLPPGDYTLFAWHEKFGEKKIDFTIVAYESKLMDFTFESDVNP